MVGMKQRSAMLKRKVRAEKAEQRRLAGLSEEQARAIRGRQLTDHDYLLTLRRLLERSEGRIGTGWMSAADVAKEHQVGRAVVAFALRRLCEGGQVEEMVVDVAGSTRNEHSRLYRARPKPGEHRRVSDLPAWLSPQAVVSMGESRMVKGSASMTRWVVEDDEKDKELAPPREKKPAAAAG